MARLGWPRIENRARKNMEMLAHSHCESMFSSTALVYSRSTTALALKHACDLAANIIDKLCYESTPLKPSCADISKWTDFEHTVDPYPTRRLHHLL